MNIQSIKKQGKLTKAKVRLIARLKGDGCILIAAKTNYWIKLESIDKELLNQFSFDLKSVYGLKSKKSVNKSGFTGRLIEMVYIRSKLAYLDLVKYGPYRSENWIIPEIIFESSKELKKEFIRTFADDEGSITRSGIYIYSINLKGLYQLKRLIEEFGIFCKIRKGFGAKRNVFAIHISRKENLIKFREIIGFSLKRKQEKLLKL